MRGRHVKTDRQASFAVRAEDSIGARCRRARREAGLSEARGERPSLLQREAQVTVGWLPQGFVGMHVCSTCGQEAGMLGSGPGRG